MSHGWVRIGFYRYGPRKMAGRRRLALWEAEGPLCAYCCREMHKPAFQELKGPLQATIDHKIPLCRNGKDNRANVVLACRDCNELKGRLTAQEFEAAVLWGLEAGLELPAGCNGHLRPLTSTPSWRPYFDLLEMVA